MSTVLDPAMVAGWLDARAALAFEDTQSNRDAEALWRRRLGTCACGKAATHLLADEEAEDWPCSVPVACRVCGEPPSLGCGYACERIEQEAAGDCR